MNPTFYHIGSGKLSVTSTATSGTLIGDVATNIILFNAGPNTAFVNIGAAGTVATAPTTAGTGGIPVPLGFYGMTISRSPSKDVVISAICASTETATLYYSVGTGN